MCRHLWLLVLSLVLVACDKAGPKHPDALEEARAVAASAPLGAPIVQVGAVKLGVDELVAFEQMNPGLSREQAAREWMIQAALAQAALEAVGDEPDALLVERLDVARRRGLVRELLTRELEGAQIEAPSAEEIAQLVAQLEREVLERPAGLQVSHLVVLVPHDAPQDQREALFAKARAQLDAQLPRIGERPTALELGDLADQVSAAREAGDLVVASNAHLQFATREGLSAEELPAGWVAVVPEFVQVALKWASPERIGMRSEPERTPFGWHVLVVERVFEERGASRVSLEARASRQVRAQRQQAALSKRFEAVVEDVSMAIYPKVLNDEVAGTSASE
jgi:hypothetical protein